MRRMPDPDDNAEMIPFLPDIDPDGKQFLTIKRDFMPRVPPGTYVAAIFRVTGWDPDCDGSALARLEQVDLEGEATGWEANALGLYPSSWVVLDDPGELHARVGDSGVPPVHKPGDHRGTTTGETG